MRLNHGNAALRVCVDKIENGQISGRVAGQRLAEPLIFADMGQLLLQTEELLDKQDFPRAFQRRRSFGVVERPSAPPPLELTGDFMSKEEVEQSQGAVCTFVFNVLTRQNTSWQGNLDWLGARPQQSFKSALDFIRLVNKALVTN